MRIILVIIVESSSHAGMRRGEWPLECGERHRAIRPKNNPNLLPAKVLKHGLGIALSSNSFALQAHAKICLIVPTVPIRSTLNNVVVREAHSATSHVPCIECKLLQFFLLCFAISADMLPRCGRPQ